VSEEILISVNPVETRVAVVENATVQEIHIERSVGGGIVGNIYSGKVVRVLPGMQAAFVEFGESRTGFLHVSDILSADAHKSNKSARQSRAIADYLHEGKKVTVQVTKDPMGGKGARLTTSLSLSSRYLVLMPQSNHIGVSARIDESAERARLLQVLNEIQVQEEMAGSGGLIVRTAAEGTAIEELHADLRYLKRLWGAIFRRAKEADRPTVLYEDLALPQRTVRDLARPGLDRIRVDDPVAFAGLKRFCDDYVPELAGRLEYFHSKGALFDLYDVERDIELAMRRQVALKSGGYLIIDQTEAMSTIDVNTGSFVGASNLEETIFKTNLEAASVLARQLRLRNLGGIIIVDFIDMSEAEHRRQVHAVLEEAMARDTARFRITKISELGLVEMTRKRSRESLEQLLCEACEYCGGLGVVRSVETLCYDIFREILHAAPAHENAKLMVLAEQAVVDRLLQAESKNVSKLEKLTGKTISFRVETGYSREHFDIVSL
jgi:ribonuclease G